MRYRILRLALLGEIPAACHYKPLSEYREVLFRMVRRGELTLSLAQVERFLAALVMAVEEVEVRVSVEAESSRRNRQLQNF